MGEGSCSEAGQDVAGVAARAGHRLDWSRRLEPGTCPLRAHQQQELMSVAILA